ncbi:MAG: hypothetical protein KDD36_00910 [Flavobacteriales bacterium]|nr:hypothetical protein [Flavobacteriales bacterium]
MKKRILHLTSLLLFATAGVLLAQDTLNTNPAPGETIDSTNTTPPDSAGTAKKEDPNKVLVFTRDHIEQSADSTFFNVLKVKNTSSEPMTGTIEFFVPFGWGIAYTPKARYTIAPGQTEYIPFRLSIPGEAKGGMAHVVNVTFRTNQALYSENCYIKIIRKSRWSLSTNANVVYFNAYYNDVQFKVILSNKGNTPEVVYLQFDVGKNLIMPEFNGVKNARYVELPPYTDTTLTFAVGGAMKDEDTPSYLEQIWKESTVTINASTDYTKLKETIWFKKVDSEYINTKEQSASPLNAEVQFYNLMSTAQPRINTSVFGSVLFPESREVNYLVNARNIPFSPGGSRSGIFVEPQNLTAYVRYRDTKWNVIAGENIISTGIFNSSGRGVSANYKFNRDYDVYASAFQNTLYPIYNYSVGGSALVLKKFRVSSGLSYEDNQRNSTSSLAYQLMTGTTLFKKHSINGGVILGRSTFNKTPTIPSSFDTTLYGFRYRLSYNFSGTKLKVNATTTGSTRYFARGGGNSNARAAFMYMLDKKKRVNLIYDRYGQMASRFPDILYYDGNRFDHDMVRLTLSENRSQNLYIETGPTARRTKRSAYYPAYNFTTRTLNTYAGMYISARYSISNTQSITPTAIAGYSFIKETNFDSVQVFTPDRGIFSTNLSLSYRMRHWTLGAYYVYGSLNIVDAQYLIQTGKMNQVFYLRPNYERWLRNRTLKISLYMNYSIRMPSNRENSSMSARIDVFSKKGWIFYGMGNAFINSWTDIEEGRQSYKTYNFSLGVRKSFDLPQPRLKYYNVKVVCFRDVNGNKKKDEGEPMIANILTDIKRLEYDKARGHGNFAQMELLTGPNGEINYYNLPEGSYRLTFLPLTNLGDLYNVNGDKQTIVVKSHTTVYIPFAASYKIKGKIVLLRDKFSSDGAINVEGIRVTATGQNGDTYSVLTDKNGEYILNVPQAGYFTVKVNNIFGDRFKSDKEEFLIEFNGFDTFNVDFTFTEKKRQINLQGGDYQFQFLKGDNQEEDDDGGE